MDPPQGVNPNGARMDTPRESYDSHGGLFFFWADVDLTDRKLARSLSRVASLFILSSCDGRGVVSPFLLTAPTRCALGQALPQSTSPQQSSSHKPLVVCVNQGRPL